MVRYVLICLAFCLAPVAAHAATCSVPHTFVTGEVLTAPVLNANPVALAACVNNIDNANIGPAGIYASQIVPNSAATATFGGTTPYTFPVLLTTSALSTSAGCTPATGAICTQTATNKGVIDFGGPSRLDYGIATSGAFTFTGGALISAVAQACGTPSGYHIECGTTTITTCTNGSACANTLSFSTPYGTAPICTSTVISAQGVTIAYVGGVSTTQVGAGIFNGTGSTVNNVGVNWQCVGV